MSTDVLVHPTDVDRIARILLSAEERKLNTLGLIAMFHAARAEAVRDERKRLAERLHRLAKLVGRTRSVSDIRSVGAAIDGFATTLEGG